MLPNNEVWIKTKKITESEINIGDNAAYQPLRPVSCNLIVAKDKCIIIIKIEAMNINKPNITIESENSSNILPESSAGPPTINKRTTVTNEKIV